MDSTQEKTLFFLYEDRDMAYIQNVASTFLSIQKTMLKENYPTVTLNHYHELQLGFDIYTNEDIQHTRFI